MLGRGLGRVTYRNEGSLLCRVKKLGGQHLRKRAMLEAAKMALHLNCRVFYGKVEIVYMLVHTKLIKTASQAKGRRVVVFNSIFSYSYLITAT